MKLIDVKVGDKLVADGGFTCLRKGQVSVVARADKGELFIPCDDGMHCLDGQLEHHGERGHDDELVGLSWPTVQSRGT